MKIIVTFLLFTANFVNVMLLPFDLLVPVGRLTSWFEIILV